MVKENHTVKVSDHVYVIPDDSVPVVPNVGIVVGSTGTLVIDTGLGPRNAETILREAAKVSRTGQLYLVTTHFHPEHAAGSSAFPPNARFVIARVQQQEIDEQGLTMNKLFAGFSPTNAELLKDVQFRKPDVVFDREYTIDLGGGVRAKLQAPGSMHTRGDTLAFVEPDRVLFAGDVVMNRAFLATGEMASMQTWLTVLENLESLHAVKVVPSHGPMGDGSIVVEQRDLLRALQARVRELKSQGQSADDTAKTLTEEFGAKYAGWVGPNRVAAAARAFYAEVK
jgi:glyoxylase-like metal-dependent hydrolase (beta-lactamase superfamily II)